jgi:hypothetical protein
MATLTVIGLVVLVALVAAAALALVVDRRRPLGAVLPSPKAGAAAAVEDIPSLESLSQGLAELESEHAAELSADECRTLHGARGLCELLMGTRTEGAEVDRGPQIYVSDDKVWIDGVSLQRHDAH